MTTMPFLGKKKYDDQAVVASERHLLRPRRRTNRQRQDRRLLLWRVSFLLYGLLQVGQHLLFGGGSTSTLSVVHATTTTTTTATLQYPPVFIRISGGDSSNNGGVVGNENPPTYLWQENDNSCNNNNNNNNNNNKTPSTRDIINSQKERRKHPWIMGLAREFTIFDSINRGGYSDGDDHNSIGAMDFDEYNRDNNNDNDYDDDDDDDRTYWMRMQQEQYRRKQKRPGAVAANSPLFRARYPSSSTQDESSPLQRKWKQHQQQQKRHQQKRNLPIVFQHVQDWWVTNISPNLQSLPKIVCRVEPTTTLKLRKTFRPLKTIVRLGADFNTQLGVWQFKSSWEDAIIGGKLTLAMKELQFTKSWQLSVGAMEDLVTRLRFRAAINLQTFQAYARVGFRTERLTPINVVEGFTILKRIPLDGQRGSVKLEVKANVALPEPEIEYSTETQRSLIGMGDIEVSIDELNLLLDF
ncbi:hypothetical protein IV203_005025 [Nitzschia inconspicua]|uniref:Uncharacterized protein n=1 Tax=Nitzschia inconspicua TaxID=303405 RepID=A0A9K3PFZ1_9STRA|nr:hypothetical protein IV203_005025 [Nitzschia inconspicua]